MLANQVGEVYLSNKIWPLNVNQHVYTGIVTMEPWVVAERVITRALNRLMALL